MFENVEELLVHQQEHHFPCPYHDTCLMVCFKSHIDLQLHLSKNHNDSGGFAARRGRGIQVTLQQLRGEQEAHDPQPRNGNERGPARTRGVRSARGPRSERGGRGESDISVQSTPVLSRKQRDNLKHHVVWRLKKINSEKDRVEAGERLRDGIEQMPSDFAVEVQRLAEYLHNPSLTVSALGDLVKHLDTADCILANIDAIDVSWRRFTNMPLMCEFVYLLVVSYPVRERRPALEAALKDMVYGTTKREDPITVDVPVFSRASDDTPVFLTTEARIKDSFSESLLCAIAVMRRHDAAPASKMTDASRSVLAGHTKESRRQLVPLHEALSDSIGQRACDQLLALRADYFRSKMLQDQPLWAQRVWFTFKEMPVENRGLVADFLILSEELPDVRLLWIE